MSESPSVFQSVVVAFLFLMFKIFHCQEVMGWILVSCQISGFASLFFFFFPPENKRCPDLSVHSDSTLCISNSSLSSVSPPFPLSVT